METGTEMRKVISSLIFFLYDAVDCFDIERNSNPHQNEIYPCIESQIALTPDALKSRLKLLNTPPSLFIRPCFVRSYVPHKPRPGVCIHVSESRGVASMAQILANGSKRSRPPGRSLSSRAIIYQNALRISISSTPPPHRL